MGKLKWSREDRGILGARWFAYTWAGIYRIAAHGTNPSSNYGVVLIHPRDGQTNLDSRLTLARAKKSAEDHHGRNVSK